ncbi:MAG: hypothetical protein M0P01_03765, partial [Treponema sp.]|nr:hypothetical protein [Treponema sp.]
CPEAARRILPQSSDEKPVEWMDAVSAGEKLVEPAILRGCRKAPVMTVGINPNLTAYFAGNTAACWCYPVFSDTTDYAYYYRHATIFQESLSRDIIKKYIISGTELKAEDDGWLISCKRGTSHRWLDLTVQYVNRRTPVHYELTWLPEERTVVLEHISQEKDIETDKPSFRKGMVLAGKLNIPAGIPLKLYENGCGYYQRLLPVLRKFEKQTGISDASITMGEDVSMYDMVGCASPGWSSDKYDIPCSRISSRCVLEKDYVLRQLLQSRPEIIIIVSTSSLVMFEQSFKNRGGSLSFSTEGRDVYDLLSETCRRYCYFEYKKGNVIYRARIIVTPHFSYAENFVPHARFSSDAWKGFLSEFPRDAEILEKEKRIGTPTQNGMIPVGITGIEDPVQKKLGYSAWQLLLARFYDPYELITGAITTEFRNGNISFDTTTGHLARSRGSCTFCSNGKWQFPEGCAYGNC